MNTSVRKFLLVGTAGVALTLALASVAAACTGTHPGPEWFCTTTNSGCSYTFQVTSPTHSTAYDSSGGGSTGHLDASKQYQVMYVSGNHGPTTDTACETSGTIFDLNSGGSANALFSTDANGDWSAQGPIKIPNLTGTYTTCAIRTDGLGNGSLHNVVTFA